jgi:hypothetical protein
MHESHFELFGRKEGFSHEIIAGQGGSDQGSRTGHGFYGMREL